MSELDTAKMEELKTELWKAKVTASELIDAINNCGAGYEEKQMIDIKIRIVCDYIKQTIDGVDDILNKL